MLRPGIVFGGVCVSVCLSVRTKSRKLLVGNRCNLVGLCLMSHGEVVGMGDVDFHLDPIFVFF